MRRGVVPRARSVRQTLTPLPPGVTSVRVARLTDPGTRVGSQVVTSMHVFGVTTSTKASLPCETALSLRGKPCRDALRPLR